MSNVLTPTRTRAVQAPRTRVPPQSRHPRVGLRRGALTLLAAGVLVGGGWALVTPRDTSPAELHETVGVEGGWMRIDAVLDVDLSTPMTGPGMAMGSSSGIPTIPEGARRIDVDVTLAATSESGMKFDPDTFTADTALSKPSRPVASDDTSDLVPPDGALTRTLSFQVPADATEVTFHQDGGDRSVAVALGHAPAGHDH